jgi:hypothetical protein
MPYAPKWEQRERERERERERVILPRRSPDIANIIVYFREQEKNRIHFNGLFGVADVISRTALQWSCECNQKIQEEYNWDFNFLCINTGVSAIRF